eukprot:MONOS_1280.1-p1 / transcript=MONOS_1280.1 / gene=MONOS_1280 / organism=Monocercomonoides_exilis_PA203 / gene_product=unspecified product / transcript_product=unspecified product / location=Mono_scaffold00022:33000-36418(-) / protein_length=919 / sequence_SO=supercontig / SO=protein_coding / is_pseudo=false
MKDGKWDIAPLTSIKFEDIKQYSMDIGIQSLPFVVLWLLLILWFIVWLILQCVQCCVCKSDDPICKCCWEDQPKPCWAKTTKVIYAILAFLFLAATVLITFGAGKLSASYNHHVSICNDYEKNVAQVLDTIRTAKDVSKPIFDLIPSTLDIISKSDLFGQVESVHKTFQNYLDEFDQNYKKISEHVTEKELNNYILHDDINEDAAALNKIKLKCTYDPADDDPEPNCVVSEGDIPEGYLDSYNHFHNEILRIGTENKTFTETYEAVHSFTETLNATTVSVRNEFNSLVDKINKFSNDNVKMPDNIKNSAFVLNTLFDDASSEKKLRTEDMNEVCKVVDTTEANRGSIFKYSLLLENKLRCAKVIPKNNYVDDDEKSYCKEMWRTMFKHIWIEKDNSASSLSNGQKMSAVSADAANANDLSTIIIKVIDDEHDPVSFASIFASQRAMKDEFTRNHQNNVGRGSDVLDAAKTQLQEMRKKDFEDEFKKVLDGKKWIEENVIAKIDELRKSIDVEAKEKMDEALETIDKVQDYATRYTKWLKENHKLVQPGFTGIIACGALLILIILLQLVLLFPWCPKKCRCGCSSRCLAVQIIIEFISFIILFMIPLALSVACLALDQATTFLYDEGAVRYFTHPLFVDYLQKEFDKLTNEDEPSLGLSLSAGLVSMLAQSSHSYNASAFASTSSFLPVSTDYSQLASNDLLTSFAQPYKPSDFFKFNRDFYVEVVSAYLRGETSANERVGKALDTLLTKVENVLNDLTSEDAEKNPFLSRGITLGLAIQQEVANAVVQTTLMIEAMRPVVKDVTSSNQFDSIVFLLTDDPVLHAPSALWVIFVAGLAALLIVFPMLLCLMCGRTYWQRYEMSIDYDGGKVFRCVGINDDTEYGGGYSRRSGSKMEGTIPLLSKEQAASYRDPYPVIYS